MALREYRRLVALPAADLLKKRGFRKSGWRFRADRGDAGLVVAFQSSQSSDRNHLKVTVNLSIHLGLLDRDPTIFAGEGHWGRRIGEFMPVPHDHWWVCNDDLESRRAGEEIAAILDNAALPEMEALASAEALTRLWASGRSPGLTERQRVQFLGKLWHRSLS